METELRVAYADHCRSAIYNYNMSALDLMIARPVAVSGSDLAILGQDWQPVCTVPRPWR